jgi:hypothetical protein
MEKDLVAKQIHFELNKRAWPGSRYYHIGDASVRLEKIANQAHAQTVG